MTAKITIETNLEEVKVIHKLLNNMLISEIVEQVSTAEEADIILDIREKLSEFLK